MTDAREHLSPYARSIVPDMQDRDRLDFYPTPPGATRALLSVESFDGAIWEPACGEGDMTRPLREAGYRVFATDIKDYGGDPLVRAWDFLSPLPLRPSGLRHIVTNPPFRLASEFAYRARESVPGKVCLLVRLMWLESLRRRDLWTDCNLARVWVFRDRLPFQRGRLAVEGEGGGRMMPYMWAVFDPQHEGPPTLGWVTYKDFRREGEA